MSSRVNLIQPGSGTSQSRFFPVVTTFTPTYGTSVSVTLTGVGFSGATAVSFNGTPGTSLVVVNDTTITVTSPSSFTGGPISVTTIAGVAASVGSYYESSPFPASLVHLAFDEASGSTASDSSGNGHNGTLYGGASFISPGKVGSHCLALDGSGYVSIPNASGLNPTAAMSVCGWVKINDFSNYPCLFSKEGGDSTGWRIYCTNSGYLYTFIYTSGSGNPNIGTSGPLSTGVWYPVAMTWDGTTLRLYLNGSLVTYAAATGSIITTTHDIAIGAYSAAYSNKLNGYVDDFEMFDVALTDAQVAYLASL